MTEEEHRLIAYVIARQDQKLEILLDLLRSRGIIEGDDLQAFASAWNADSAEISRLLRNTKAEYAAIRKLLGL